MIFEKKYFTTGNYADYLERKTKYEKLAIDIAFYIRARKIKTILDFGCGVGFLTHGLNKAGFDCVGYDKSKWAINYGIKNITKKITKNNKVLNKNYDCLIALDVFEHNTINEIKKIINIATKFLIVRIPVKRSNEKNFYLKKSRQDKTHITCMNKKQWKEFLRKNGFIEHLRFKKETIWDSTGVYCAIFKNDKNQ